MARRTKKVKSVGRFGPRYGVSVKTQIRDIEVEQRKWHLCPECNYQKVKRLSTGIWECRHCGIQFAGGAYTPIAAMIKKIEEEKKEEGVEKDGKV